MRGIEEIHTQLALWTQAHIPDFPFINYLQGCPLAEMDHQKEWRVHAHSLHHDDTNCFCLDFSQLPEPIMYGIVAHEFGHQIAARLIGEDHTEEDADQMVREHLDLNLFYSTEHELQTLTPWDMQRLQLFGIKKILEIE